MTTSGQHLDRSATGPERGDATERPQLADLRDRAAAHREQRADKREHAADARDRIADERDRVADERDRVADERDDAADDRAAALDLREAGLDERDRAAAAVAALADARVKELVAEVDGLHAAMEHRSVIEQAKGVIMHTMRCSADAAFAVLVAQSQTENRKLRDVAQDLAAAQAHPTDQ